MKAEKMKYRNIRDFKLSAVGYGNGAFPWIWSLSRS